MSLTDDVRRVAHEEPRLFGDNAEFRALRDFYERMKAAGLVRRNEYALPLLDTVGRGANRQSRLRRQ